MRHGAASHFSLYWNLFEVFFGNIEPHIHIKVNEYIIKMTDSIQNMAGIVMTLYLCCEWVKFHAQILFHKFLRHSRPVDIWKCSENCTVISGCTVKFGFDFHTLYILNAGIHSISIYLKFFSYSSRCCRLSVCVCKHSVVFMFLSKSVNNISHLCCTWKPYICKPLFQHAGIRSIVDIF